MKPRLAITIGDLNGIGPEIAIKAVAHPSVRRLCRPVLVGPLAVFEHVRGRLKLNLKLDKGSPSLITGKGVPVIDVGDGIAGDIQYGMVTKVGGRNAGRALEKGVEMCVQRTVVAMVTAPVSKEALHLAGYDFPGQTEMVTLLSRSRRVAMMLCSNVMRVGLVTIHTPLRDVANQISQEKVVEKIDIVASSLRKDFGIAKPRLAVLALNPHAGEHGHIGTEDDDIIAPALETARKAGIYVDGPFPADGFFGNRRDQSYDAVIAMYHDQGLIPLKMSSFGKGVNFSAGLSIVRTSPDHGTAFDIAGKNKADVSSMLEAIRLAVQIAHHRQRHD